MDDFLKPDDPRVMSEDLTDKFDFCFLFGDLKYVLAVPDSGACLTCVVASASTYPVYMRIG